MSSPSTWRIFPRTSSSRTHESPIGFGRHGARVAKGPRGVVSRSGVTTSSAGLARSNQYTSQMRSNPSRSRNPVAYSGNKHFHRAPHVSPQSRLNRRSVRLPVWRVNDSDKAHQRWSLFRTSVPLRAGNGQKDGQRGKLEEMARRQTRGSQSLRWGGVLLALVRARSDRKAGSGLDPGANTASSGEGDPLAPSSVVRMTCRDENGATQRRHVPFVTPFVTLSDSSSLQ